MTDVANKNSREEQIWRPLTFGLAGVVVSVSLSWLAIAGSIVPKEEVRQMIHSEAPYIEDRKFIVEALTNIIKDVRSNKEGIVSLRERVAAILEKVK